MSSNEQALAKIPEAIHKLLEKTEEHPNVVATQIAAELKLERSSLQSISAILKEIGKNYSSVQLPNADWYTNIGDCLEFLDRVIEESEKAEKKD